MEVVSEGTAKEPDASGAALSSGIDEQLQESHGSEEQDHDRDCGAERQTVGIFWVKLGSYVRGADLAPSEDAATHDALGDREGVLYQNVACDNEPARPRPD